MRFRQPWIKLWLPPPTPSTLREIWHPSASAGDPDRMMSADDRALCDMRASMRTTHVCKGARAHAGRRAQGRAGAVFAHARMHLIGVFGKGELRATGTAVFYASSRTRRTLDSQPEGMNPNTHLARV